MYTVVIAVAGACWGSGCSCRTECALMGLDTFIHSIAGATATALPAVMRPKATGLTNPVRLNINRVFLYWPRNGLAPMGPAPIGPAPMTPPTTSGPPTALSPTANGRDSTTGSASVPLTIVRPATFGREDDDTGGLLRAGCSSRAGCSYCTIGAGDSWIFPPSPPGKLKRARPTAAITVSRTLLTTPRGVGNHDSAECAGSSFDVRRCRRATRARFALLRLRSPRGGLAITDRPYHTICAGPTSIPY